MNCFFDDFKKIIGFFKKWWTKKKYNSNCGL